jgi:hypothetical protein
VDYEEDKSNESKSNWNFSANNGYSDNNCGNNIMEPPMTDPVVDAADRANRLQKATDLALSGITVRQAAAHYGIPRTTLCAYMKRKGLAGRRSGAISQVPQPRQAIRMSQDSCGGGGQQEDEQNEFPFLGLAELVGDSYDLTQNQNENEGEYEEDEEAQQDS